MRSKDEIVAFANPVAVAGDSFLFEYAQLSESEKVLLDAFFDKAQLSETTVAALKSLHVVPPTTSGEIAHLTSNFGAGSCATKLRVEPVGGPFSSVEFSQNGDDISSDYRALGVRFIGTDGLVTLTPQGAFQNGMSPCRVELSVANGNSRRKDSCLSRSSCRPANPSGSTGEISPNAPAPGKPTVPRSNCSALGPQPMTSSCRTPSPIRALDPKTGKADNPPTLEARGERHAPLTVSSFAINQNQLEITASGKGRALRHGSVVRQNLLEAVNKYPISAALLGAGNLALIAWVKRGFLPPRQREGG